jgi:hypothetical protein
VKETEGVVLALKIKLPLAAGAVPPTQLLLLENVELAGVALQVCA